VLNSHACNIKGSLTGDTLVLPFGWKRLFWAKIMFFTVQKSKRLAVFLWKVNSTYTDKLDILALNINGFLKRETMLLLSLE
jgi:hypothetical protein